MSELRPLYIFDLDGTLALIDHRRPILDKLDNPHRWDDFYKACIDDKPNLRIIEIAETFWWYGDADIKIWSGRSDLVYRQTKDWLKKHINFTTYAPRILKMRKHGDNTPDEELKKKWYEQLSEKDKKRLACVFDDRQKVVNMWRSLGITCLQVAPGDF